MLDVVGVRGVYVAVGCYEFESDVELSAGWEVGGRFNVDLGGCGKAVGLFEIDVGVGGYVVVAVCASPESGFGDFGVDGSIDMDGDFVAEGYGVGYGFVVGGSR